MNRFNVRISSLELGKMSKREIVFSVVTLFLGAIVFGGYPLMNKYRQTHPIDKQCTIESAEVFNSSSGTGGISTSSTELKIDTLECGTVYVDYSIEPKKSYQEMADDLNQYQGQQVTLIFPPFQLPAGGDYALGYGYRL